MYNEEDRREDQQTSGEQAPDMNIISSMRRQELCLTGCRLSGIKKRHILLGKRQGRQWLWQCFSGLGASAVFIGKLCSR